MQNMNFQELNSELVLEELIKIRRGLHQIPEIGLQEYQTSKFVRKYLSQIQGVQILEPIPSVETAVIAIINVQNAQQKFLFRCQLDALAWEQKSGEQFSSKNGLHHACGHDAHMAIMMVACKKIASKREFLKQSLVFCFQPGQQGKGGAKKLISNYPKLLDSVTYAFALHGGNHFQAGYALASPGVISANSDRFEIKIRGKGCHVMIPESGIDSNLIGCNLVSQLYSLKQTKLSPLQRGVICVTKVQGGSGFATIAQNFHIVGSLRMITSKAQQKMKSQIISLSNNFCKTFGAECEVKFFSSHYRSVQNNERATSMVRKVLKKIFPEQRIKEQVPSFNGEDFCEFSQRIPSCYFILGAGLQNSFNQNHESEYPLHSNRHRLDQRFMFLGVKFWIQLAFSQN